jgi:predicted RNase H-like HicB family nuclease
MQISDGSRWLVESTSTRPLISVVRPTDSRSSELQRIVDILIHVCGYLAGGKYMKQMRQFTGIIEREGDWFVALCPELDIASQGKTVEEARANLIEAIELFFEAADASEIESRLHTEVFVTRMEVAVG